MSTAGGVPGVLAAHLFGFAIPEELAFRGLILPVRELLTDRVWATVFTVATTSTLFGLAHNPTGWTNVLTAAAGGAIFAALTLSMRSIWPPIIAHWLFNAALVVGLS